MDELKKVTQAMRVGRSAECLGNCRGGVLAG